MRNLRGLTLVWLVGIPAAPAAAQNALLNPDFDVDVAGWQTFIGSLDLDAKHEDADACPESSGGRLVAASQPGPEFLGVLQATDSCLDVNPLQDVWIDATLWLRSAGFVAVGLTVLEYTDDACTTFLDPPVQPVIDLSVGSTPGTEHLSVTTSMGVESVGLQIETGAIVPNALLLDRLYLGVVERVFADDFEGGSTCRWSAAVDGRPTRRRHRAGAVASDGGARGRRAPSRDGTGSGKPERMRNRWLSPILRRIGG